jgi:hypothetical protein
MYILCLKIGLLMLNISNLLFQISHLSTNLFLKIVIELEPSISKLYFLDLDILGEILKHNYSNTGRPATLQSEIFRSFSLMLFQKETNLKLYALIRKVRENMGFSLNIYHLVILG